MKPGTLDPHSEQTKEKKDGRADVVGESQLVEVASALEERVDEPATNKAAMSANIHWRRE